ncbi:MAG: YkgJ family cysteine cluster protein [Anaerolineaceae bacterium]|nr:YkgJ family cysteine cluster protein [Anaerolineaceae bacterium]
MTERDINDTLNTYKGSQVVRPDDPFPFSCRGCGHICCTKTSRLLLHPASAARLDWAYQESAELREVLSKQKARWASLGVCSETGVPLMMIIPARQTEDTYYCPFLIPEMETENDHMVYSGIASCAIHQIRPSVCRLFPLGRRVVIGEPGLQVEYRLMMKCPGFEAEGSDDPVYPGYQPPDESRSVKDWIEDSFPAHIQVEEEFYYQRIVIALRKTNLRMSTKQAGEGILNEQQTINLGINLVYNPPLPVWHKAYDGSRYREMSQSEAEHSILMDWLTLMEETIYRLGEDMHSTPNILET